MAFNQSALRNYFQWQKQPISGRGKTTAFVNDLDSFITFTMEVLCTTMKVDTT